MESIVSRNSHINNMDRDSIVSLNSHISKVDRDSSNSKELINNLVHRITHTDLSDGEGRSTTGVPEAIDLEAKDHIGVKDVEIFLIDHNGQLQALLFSRNVMLVTKEVTWRGTAL